MDRETRYRLRRIDLRIKKLMVRGFWLSIVAILIFNFYESTPVEIVSKRIDCEEGRCWLFVELLNDSSVRQVGLAKIRYVRKVSSTSNMGPNDGYVYKTFGVEAIPFSIDAGEQKIYRRQYNSSYLGVILIGRVTLGENAIRQNSGER